MCVILHQYRRTVWEIISSYLTYTELHMCLSEISWFVFSQLKSSLVALAAGLGSMTCWNVIQWVLVGITTHIKHLALQHKGFSASLRRLPRSLVDWVDFVKGRKQKPIDLHSHCLMSLPQTVKGLQGAMSSGDVTELHIQYGVTVFWKLAENETHLFTVFVLEGQETYLMNTHDHSCLGCNVDCSCTDDETKANRLHVKC